MRTYRLQNIQILGDELGGSAATEYERNVVGALDTIQLNRVGSAVFTGLTRSLTIRPYTGTRPNGTASAVSTPASGVLDHRRYRCDNAAPITNNGNPARYTTGGGTGSVIRFSPSQWMTSGVADSRRVSIAAAGRTDEVLFHETTHAIHQMAGQMNCSDAPPGFDTKDEFWAILLTNIYCSAWNRPLRRDHHGHTTISLTAARELFGRYSTMIDWMCVGMPAVTRAIARIDWIAFNPVRDSYVRRAAL